eukprot:97120_1
MATHPALVYTTGKQADKEASLYYYYLESQSLNDVSYQSENDWTQINQQISNNNVRLIYQQMLSKTEWDKSTQKIGFRFVSGSLLKLTQHIYKSDHAYITFPDSNSDNSSSNSTFEKSTMIIIIVITLSVITVPLIILLCAYYIPGKVDDEKVNTLINEEENILNSDNFGRNNNIINNQNNAKSYRKTFIIAITVMLICGSSNDFLGKLAYQILPGGDSGLKGLEVDYWATWMLTAGSFFICSFALISGRKSFKLLHKQLFLKICIPSFMDLFVTGGRYLSLVFLPAAVISILKNGCQLFFLALIRRFYRKKILTKNQWIGLWITITGLILVSLQDILRHMSVEDQEQLRRTLIGTALLFVVGFLGAIRNTFEEILLQNDESRMESDFLVGMESIISLFFMVIFGVILLFTDPFHEDEDYDDIGEALHFILGYPAFIICFVLFIIAIYGKDTMQMKVAKLTSSLTRKLFQQLYPIGTWILSIVTFYIYSLYGEEWNNYQFLRLGGFII